MTDPSALAPESINIDRAEDMLVTVSLLVHEFQEIVSAYCGRLILTLSVKMPIKNKVRAMCTNKTIKRYQKYRLPCTVYIGKPLSVKQRGERLSKKKDR